MLKYRYSESTDNPEVPLYKISGGEKYDAEIASLIKQCRDITAKIQAGSVRKIDGKWWTRIEPVWVEDADALKILRKSIKEKVSQWGRWGKNILKKSKRDDTMIGHWKDSNVFPLGEKKFIYKESAQQESNQEASSEHVMYLRRKYEILRKYLDSLIPQSRFVLWEVNHPTRIVKGMEMVDIPQKSIITLQRRIMGYDLQKMGKEEKNNPKFLMELKKAHQKYILLKMFISVIAEEIGLPWNTFDIKMDLWPLSDMDRFDIQDPTSVEKNLTSPNIMWDGANIFFVDMDTGIWDDEKEKLYAYLMMPDVIQRWDEMMGNMGLLAA